MLISGGWGHKHYPHPHHHHHGHGHHHHHHHRDRKLRRTDCELIGRFLRLDFRHHQSRGGRDSIICHGDDEDEGDDDGGANDGSGA